MSNYKLLIDFGSTFTKGVMFNLDTEEVVALARVPSTVDTDVRDGFNNLMAELEDQTSSTIVDQSIKLACSSAAGGLRMVIVGLIPDLTVEAGKKAALNAGAKVVGAFAGILCNDDMRKINNLTPDLILLAGGSDGGNKEVIIENSQKLSLSDLKIPVIVVGNKNANEICSMNFRNAGKEAMITENVMPSVDKLNIEPARKAIRELFIKKIINAKGINKIKERADILMPTPDAVLQAVSLISNGTPEEEGLGEIMTIDVGGATTDVYSVASGSPTTPNVIIKGLPEPLIKRTVEGDIGVRHNAMSILEIVGAKNFLKEIKQVFPDNNYNEGTIINYCKKLTQNSDYIPKSILGKAIDLILIKYAVRIGIKRHVGSLQSTYIPGIGESFIQTGKDLRNLRLVIGSGGAITSSPEPLKILQELIFNKKEPTSLKPYNPIFMLDGKYIMFSLGLLSNKYPNKVIRMAKKYFNYLQFNENSKKLLEV
jgi:uncharacterized protein (TIGR01319 family)